MAPLTPPLKWAGGKRWQVPHIKPLWDASGANRLVEPFCGGLAVALGLQPKRAWLNDINPHLINFYRWLQSNMLGPIPNENEREAYDRHRVRFNELAAGEGWKTSEAATVRTEKTIDLAETEPSVEEIDQMVADIYRERDRQSGSDQET